MGLIFSPVLVFLAGLVGLSAGTNELIAVVQLFRHGQRTPIVFYANDPYADLNKYFGGIDYGQLTNEGKRQHYKLGQTTRKRYSSFLPKKYDRSFFYAQTTDVDRTHMSAQSNLHGLFPASGTELWKTGTTWHPIPVHPSNPSIISPSSSCNNYYTLTKQVLLTEDFTTIDETYAELYQYLTEHSGENVTSVEQANTVWDCLKIEHDLGFPLPSWASSVYPYPLRNLSGYYFESLTHTTQLKRIFMGPWFNEVVTYLEDMASNSTCCQKYKMYSAHDSNIAAVLNSFGSFNPPYPPYFASTIWIELWRKDWKHVVNVYSKDADTITQLSVNGCALDCPLPSFREVLSGILIDVETSEAECASSSS